MLRSHALPPRGAAGAARQPRRHHARPPPRRGLPAGDGAVRRARRDERRRAATRSPSAPGSCAPNMSCVLDGARPPTPVAGATSAPGRERRPASRSSKLGLRPRTRNGGGRVRASSTAVGGDHRSRSTPALTQAYPDVGQRPSTPSTSGSTRIDTSDPTRRCSLLHRRTAATPQAFAAGMQRPPDPVRPRPELPAVRRRSTCRRDTTASGGS